MRLPTIALITTAMLLLACSRDTRPFNPSGLAGAQPDPPLTKPDFVLTDTEGKPFHFRPATEGYVTLLFFGYTHCPDVCPVHLTNISAALHTLDPEVQGKIKVVFVTTDPGRDTPTVMRAWLNHFDPAFIGLTGTADSITAIQRRIQILGVASRDPSAVPGDSNYTVGHSAVVLAYTTDDLAHVVYPFGVRQADWARDLPRLVAGGGRS